MKLAPGEKTIMAYFSGSGAAQRAARELKLAGYNDTQVDRVSRYGATSDEEYNNSVNNSATISGITLLSASAPEATDSERVLMAANSSASGYGDTGYGVSGSKAFLLTVVTSDNKAPGAQQIIENNEGML